MSVIAEDHPVLRNVVVLPPVPHLVHRYGRRWETLKAKVAPSFLDACCWRRSHSAPPTRSRRRSCGTRQAYGSLHMQRGLPCQGLQTLAVRISHGQQSSSHPRTSPRALLRPNLLASGSHLVGHISCWSPYLCCCLGCTKHHKHNVRARRS